MLVPFRNLDSKTSSQSASPFLHNERISTNHSIFRRFHLVSTTNHHRFAISWWILVISSTIFNSSPPGGLFLGHPGLDSSLFISNSRTRPSFSLICTEFDHFWPRSSSNLPVSGSSCVQNVSHSLVSIEQKPRVTS